MGEKVGKKLRKPVNLALLMIIATSALFLGFTVPQGKYHSNAGRMLLQASGLTTFDGTYFTGSGNCVACHGTDPNGIALVDADGNDVSPVNDWQASIMANSAKDPFWQAKVRHEILVSPSITEDIENTCTDCHAPQGHSEFHMTGQGTHYSMEYLASDSLGLDGVGCMGCHGIEDIDLANTNNGSQEYSELSVAYGTFADPWSGPMIQFSGIAPAQGEHMGKSEVCAGCHSLFVNTVDYDGNLTGSTFFEQTTYHEWLNSSYDEMEVECQSCHMPDAGEVKVSSVPEWLFPRPFQKHYFVGGNSSMLKIMRDNAGELEISATTDQFNMVIERTEQLLQEESLELDVTHVGNEEDSAVVQLTLENLAGHKFPSGYASRLLFVEFRMTNEDGDVLFHNGIMDDDYEIVDRDPEWEPHYDVIRNEEDVQIYEQVIADVEGEVTTVLERAAYPLKDNRLVPVGYSTAHSAYDTTAMAGIVLTDPNFNQADGVEGTGSDILEYRVALDGYVGPIQIETRVWYQALPPRWMEMMFSWDDPEINSFKAMYEGSDQSPVLVAEQVLDSTTDLDEWTLSNITIGPNPTSDGRVRVFGLNAEKHNVSIHSNDGRMIFQGPLREAEIQLPDVPGVYQIILDGKRSFRVVRL